MGEVFAIVNSSREESLHHHCRGTLSVSAQLALRDRRISATIAELDIQKLSGRNVDFDAAVLGGSLWYRNNRWEASDACTTHHGLKITLLPTFDADGCHDANA